MNETKNLWLRILLFIFAVVIVFLCLRVTFTKDIPKATPSVSPSPSKTEHYLDMMTGKCYNESEVEVECKG